MQIILRILLVILLLWSLGAYMLNPAREVHMQAAFSKWHVIVEQGWGFNQTE